MILDDLDNADVYRNLSERCLLTAFVRFSGGATSVKQFIQSPGYVTIIVYALNANNPIVVPLDGRPRPGENVLDLFGGSGSTLIAAEQTGRRAFLMELDAPYCDVIVTRWEEFTGKKAERVSADEEAGHHPSR